jgi:hypothetical protein
MKQQIQQAPQRLIWDDIDLELQPMSDEQKSILFQNEEYVETYTRIQGLVNIEILNLVKAKIESTQEGNELLRNQLKILRKLKGKIIEDTNREMEMFRRFKEFSKHNPEVTYDEFIKNNI